MRVKMVHDNLDFGVSFDIIMKVSDECMVSKRILDINKSGDDNFNSILDITKQTLDEAIAIFFGMSTVKETDEILKQLKYDYTSLYTTIVGSLLNMLCFVYSDNLSKRITLKNMSNIEDRECSEEAMNNKRVRRIMTDYVKRNERHAIYLNSPEYKPTVNAADALWYALISDFPILKRFLHNDFPNISKNFFDELNLIYDKINTYKGYDRFFLLHKTEMMSKLEMFYKVLALIKRDKRSRKLSDHMVQKMLYGMKNLHIVPFNQVGFSLILQGGKLSPIYQEIMEQLPSAYTINSIVFNTDSLISHYISVPKAVFEVLEILNFIYNAVVFHLSWQIVKELVLPDGNKGFELVKDIQQCRAATDFFDSYVDSNNLVNRKKDCSHDITFTHFKKVYMLKKES